MLGAIRDQEKVSDLLGMELQTILSYHVGDNSNETGVLLKISQWSKWLLIAEQPPRLKKQFYLKPSRGAHQHLSPPLTPKGSDHFPKVYLQVFAALGEGNRWE